MIVFNKIIRIPRRLRSALSIFIPTVWERQGDRKGLHGEFFCWRGHWVHVVYDGQPQGSPPHVHPTPAPTIHALAPTRGCETSMHEVHRRIVGAGAVLGMGGDPCGRPSVPISVVMGPKTYMCKDRKGRPYNDTMPVFPVIIVGARLALALPPTRRKVRNEV